MNILIVKLSAIGDVIHTLPSEFGIGWRPRSLRSMIARRAFANRQSPRHSTP